MTRPVFSPELFNARVETQIHTFFDSINNFYGRRGWAPSPPHRENTTWSNEDFTVTIVSCYRDGAFKRVRFIMRNLPGYTQKPSHLTSHRALRYEHHFVFDLPREYPQNIGMIRPTAETPLFHPRLSSSGTGPACYSVRGELDRILEDLPFFVLLKSDRVEPPSQFQSDRGLNTVAMAWYEADAENIIATLDQLWDERHKTPNNRRVPEHRIRILEEAASTSKLGQRPPRILTDTPRKGKVRILHEDEP